MHATRKLRTLARLVRDADVATLRRVLEGRLASVAVAYGLRRDLAEAFAAPAAKVPVAVRLLGAADAAALFAVTEQTAPQTLGEIQERSSLLRANIGTGYVATTAADEPCYVQWLFSARDNEALRDFFGGLFRPLSPDEALLEGAFTPERFRGLGIMSSAMALIAQRAAEPARYVYTYVSNENVASLKGCRRAGFTPHHLRVARWRAFRHSVTFEPLSEPVLASLLVQLAPSGRPSRSTLDAALAQPEVRATIGHPKR